MIRSPGRVATAVRAPDQQIIVKSDAYTSLAKRHRLLGIPVLRGAVSFFEMLYIGLGALVFSADVASGECEKTENGRPHESTKAEKIKSALMLGGSVLLAFGIGIGLFFALPLLLTEGLGLSENALSFNLVAGGIRAAFFLLYLWAISRWKEIGRILAYHGAEHKSIFTFELGEELTVESARKHGTRHPRCGTSFLLIVVILAILLFATADSIVELKIGHRPTLPQRFLTHFSLLPLLGGISFELLKLSGRKRDSVVVRWLTAPGLWLQRITTREPDDGQLEVAIAALKGALEEGGSESEHACTWPASGPGATPYSSEVR